MLLRKTVNMRSASEQNQSYEILIGKVRAITTYEGFVDALESISDYAICESDRGDDKKQKVIDLMRELVLKREELARLAVNEP